MRLHAIVLLALLGAFLAGCATAGSAPSLDGTSWRLQSWSESTLDPTDYNLTLQFEDGNLGGTPAVNSYGGPYPATAGGDLQIGEVVSTLMAGPEDAMRAEAAYLERLQQVEKFSLSGDTLTLLDAGGNELLVFARE